MVTNITGHIVHCTVHASGTVIVENRSKLSEFFKDPHQDVSATNVNVRKRARGERMFFAQYQAEDANGAAKQSCFFVYVYLSVK